MKKIYKYAIEITDDQDIVMPVGAKILTVQNQNGVPCIWAMVDPNSEKRMCISECMAQGIMFQTVIGWNT